MPKKIGSIHLDDNLQLHYFLYIPELHFNLIYISKLYLNFKCQICFCWEKKYKWFSHTNTLICWTKNNVNQTNDFRQENNNMREYREIVYSVQSNRFTTRWENASLTHYTSKIIARDYNMGYKKITFGVFKLNFIFYPNVSQSLQNPFDDPKMMLNPNNIIIGISIICFSLELLPFAPCLIRLTTNERKLNFVSVKTLTNPI